MKFFVALCVLFSPLAHAKVKYNNESELTVILNGGNTDQETWNAKTLNTFTKTKNVFKLGGHYSYGTADGVLNTRNNDVNLRYERSLSNSWSAFAGVQREEDFFAQIDYRWNYDTGGKYNFIKEEKQKLFSEAGYRRTLESDLQGRKRNSSKVRLYTEWQKQQNESLYVKFWVEALPNISESDDWQVSFEPSLNLNVNKSLTLKFAYLHKYDNLPPNDTRKNDYQYTTSLIARF